MHARFPSLRDTLTAGVAAMLVASALFTGAADYYLIESTNPKVQGFDGATMSFVEYQYELAK